MDYGCANISRMYRFISRCLPLKNLTRSFSENLRSSLSRPIDCRLAPPFPRKSGYRGIVELTYRKRPASRQFQLAYWFLRECLGPGSRTPLRAALGHLGASAPLLCAGYRRYRPFPLPLKPGSKLSRHVTADAQKGTRQSAPGGDHQRPWGYPGIVKQVFHRKDYEKQLRSWSMSQV